MIVTDYEYVADGIGLEPDMDWAYLDELGVVEPYDMIETQVLGRAFADIDERVSIQRERENLSTFGDLVWRTWHATLNLAAASDAGEISATWLRNMDLDCAPLLEGLANPLIREAIVLTFTVPHLNVSTFPRSQDEYKESRPMKWEPGPFAADEAMGVVQLLATLAAHTHLDPAVALNMAARLALLADQPEKARDLAALSLQWYGTEKARAILREVEVDVWWTRYVPMASESILRNVDVSLDPPKYMRMLAASISVFIPPSPHTPAPCAQDWRKVTMQIPLDPKCEYNFGSSRHGQTLAASSKTTIMGTGRRPRGPDSAAYSAA